MMCVTATDTPNPLTEVRSFVQFCRDRLSPQDQDDWGRLYDCMCYVAAPRLYRDWGYAELSARGASLGLHNLARLRSLAAGLHPSAKPRR